MSRPAISAPRRSRVSVALIVTLAVQSAVPPFATDTYTPAFPQVTADLGTAAAAVGLTLTLFFVGYGAGQLIGGPISDRFGRRTPLIIGGIVCTIGAVGCALAPSIGVLLAMRLVQGVGGGIAATIARAVVIDVARGDLMARVMSILMALGGLAPAIAPVIGGVVLTAGGGWRTIFWILVGFGILMTVTAAIVVPETLPPVQRHRGGLGEIVRGFGSVLVHRSFVAYLVVGAFSAFAMLGYIANASYVLQGINGMAPLPFSLFFASTALAQVILSIVNARLVGRFRPRRLIGLGLIMSAVAAGLIALAVFVWDAASVPLCAGFLVLMAAQAFTFGNAAALAVTDVTESAGSASALLGIAQALALAISAPLASSGGTSTAVPMVLVIVGGVLGVAISFFAAPRVLVR